MPPQNFDDLLESIQATSVPIQSIDEDEIRDRILSADLIWGYDPQQKVMPLFYGKELLEDISKGRSAEFGYLALLCFTIDMSTGDAEVLRQAVQSLRGSCSYNSRS